MIKIFCSQAWLNAKINQGGLSITEFLVYRVALSIITLVFYCLIALYTTGEVDLTRWVVGNAFVLCVYEGIFKIGRTFDEERYYGRLRSIIVSPTNKLTVVMYNGMYAIFLSFLTIFGSFVVGGLIFGVVFSDINLTMFLIAVISAAFACVGLGIVLAVCALITDSMFLMLNTIASLLLIFSGANFPVSQLPVFAQWIAFMFPLNRSVSAANMSFSGSFNNEYWELIIGELVLGIVLFILAFLLIKIVERVAIKKATLEIF